MLTKFKTKVLNLSVSLSPFVKSAPDIYKAKYHVIKTLAFSYLQLIMSK